MKNSLQLALLATLAGASLAKDYTFTHGDIGVSLVGQSGQIKIYPDTQSNTTANKFIKVKLENLQELDSHKKHTGQLASVPNFQGFNWYNLSDADYQGHPGQRVDGSDILSVKGQEFPFSASVWVFEDDSNLYYAGGNMTVPYNGLKFTYDFQDFPWSGPNAEYLKLTFSVNMQAKGKSDRDAGWTVSNSSGITVYTITVGNTYLDVPAAAVIDGTSTDIDVDIVSTPAHIQIGLIFPRFVSTVEYDPVMSFQTDNKNSAASGYFFLTTLCVVFVGLFLPFWEM